VSNAALYGFDIMSIDWSSAFLKSVSFDKISQMMKDLGLPAPDFQRKAYVKAPGNVWFHLRKLSPKQFNVAQVSLWVLELLKGMYGLDDAPLLWQICLRWFFVIECKARVSSMDDNAFLWKDNNGSLAGEASVHVDDGLLSGSKSFLGFLVVKVEDRYGECTKQYPPMDHVGLQIDRGINGSGYKLHQSRYALALKRIEIPKHETTLEWRCSRLREGVGGLLFLCYTRGDLIGDVVLLQTKVCSADIEDLKAYNTIVHRARQYHYYGLLYSPLETPVRCIGFSDIGFATSKSSYAVEALAVFRAHDRHHDLHEDSATGDYDASNINGSAHILVHQAKKAKRVSHGTSHAESLGSYSLQSMCEMVALRLTEQAWQSKPSLEDLIEVELQGLYDTPIDIYTDCRDFFELTCGLKGVPQDRSQRLIIMSMRERRALRKFRSMSWINTQAMLVNAMTKHISFCPLLHNLFTYGEIAVHGKACIRWSKRLDDFDESTLLESLD
jgi:hypothetical protein